MAKCEKCDGHGWRTVKEDYAVRTARRPLHLDSPNPDDRQRASAIYEAAIGAARNSVYPCRECNSSLFYRWAGGHLESTHDRSACVECQQPRKGRYTPKEPREPDLFKERPRKDLDT